MGARDGVSVRVDGVLVDAHGPHAHVAAAGSEWIAPRDMAVDDGQYNILWCWRWTQGGEGLSTTVARGSSSSGQAKVRESRARVVVHLHDPRRSSLASGPNAIIATILVYYLPKIYRVQFVYRP